MIHHRALQALWCLVEGGALILLPKPYRNYKGTISGGVRGWLTGRGSMADQSQGWDGRTLIAEWRYTFL